MSETYNASYYRNSQYASYEEAYKNGGVYHWEETYGYSSTKDSFINAIEMLSCFDNQAIREFRFFWKIDGVLFPEMNFTESHDLIDASYDYFSKNPEVRESAKQSLTLR